MRQELDFALTYFVEISPERGGIEISPARTKFYDTMNKFYDENFIPDDPECHDFGGVSSLTEENEQELLDILLVDFQEEFRKEKGFDEWVQEAMDDFTDWDDDGSELSLEQAEAQVLDLMLECEVGIRCFCTLYQDNLE